MEIYRDFQKAEDEVLIELKEANIQKINDELSDKQDTLISKNLEILHKTDSLKIINDELTITKSARDLLLKNNDTLKKIAERLDTRIPEANITLKERNNTLCYVI